MFSAKRFEAPKAVQITNKLSYAVTTALTFFAAHLAQAQGHEGHAGHGGGHDPALHPAVHGMVLFGQDKLFISHIPMFSGPHQWQLVFEVELSHATADAKAQYNRLAHAPEQKLITLKPDAFPLNDLISGRLSSFTAALYQGNFEQGGQVILDVVNVNVKTKVLAQPLSLATPPLANLTYVVANDAQNLYLVHLLSAPSGFDSVLQTKKTGSSEGLPKTGETVVFPTISETSANALNPGLQLAFDQAAGKWTGRVQNPLSPTASLVKVVSNFYCTMGPDFFQPCQ